MGSNLKTLKDLERVCYKATLKDKSYSLTWKDMEKTLKAEAIKDIKHHEGLIKKAKMPQTRYGWIQVIEYIMWKNDITEDDLK